MELKKGVALSLPKGYKQTDVGIIPSDWDVKQLGDIGNIATGTTPPTNNRDNYGEEYFFVSPADLGKGKYIINTEKKLSKLGFDIARKYPANSILFTCIGSTIGKSGIAKIELTSNQQINAVFPNELYSSDFLFYFLSFISPKIKLGASEQAVPMINKTEFAKTLIALPTKAEQTAIATALSDADALISSLEKLIEKKRNIKQGAMQQLLKPKKGWVVKKLGDYVKITSGESPSRFNFASNGIPYYKVDQLNNCEKYLIETPYYVESNNTIPKGSIIFPKRGASILLNKVRILKENALMDTNLMTLTLTEEINSEFIYYLLIHTELWRIADTTSIPQINNKHINPLELSFPASEVEQKEIALILSDMDNEITALEKKLSKSKMLKQGMMQELLTGKIRLL